MADQAPDKPKRKRRTKAEMEAARAAVEKPKAQVVNAQGFEDLVPVKKPPTQGVGVIGRCIGHLAYLILSSLIQIVQH